MSSNSSRHDHREFSYKPQFYEPDNIDKDSGKEFDTEHFAKKMREKWHEKRPSTRDERRKSSRKTIIWAALFVIMLAFIYYKFFMN